MVNYNKIATTTILHINCFCVHELGPKGKINCIENFSTILLCGFVECKYQKLFRSRYIWFGIEQGMTATSEINHQWIISADSLNRLRVEIYTVAEKLNQLNGYTSA